MTTPANPDDLLAFLRACYDERERTAREGIPFGAGHWQAEDSGLIRDSEGGCVVHDDGEQDRATAEHIADNDPAYVLADLDAKRRIMAIHRRRADVFPDAGGGTFDNCCDGCGYEGICDDPVTEDINDCPILRLLALPFAARDGYRSEWAPA